ncbi:hypothetical protein JXA32_05505 [Candidatus Sumerlaeota bacterium]|nr:hypothetical protein [Candidatus Sumerlaeota bacterium]
MTYYFKHAEHVADAFQTFNKLFPKTMERVDDWYLVDHEDLTHDEEYFRNTIAMCKWEYAPEPPSNRKAVTQRFADCLMREAAWKRRDPVYWKQECRQRHHGLYAGRFGAWRRQHNEEGIPFGPKARFLIGARNDEQAQYVLKILCNLDTTMVGACPVAWDAGNSPFSFFWELEVKNGVFGWEPPHAILLNPDVRIWWRATESRQPAIYIEWPYEILSPMKWLSKLQWGDASPHRVLLSSRPPHIVDLYGDSVFLKLPVSTKITTAASGKLDTSSGKSMSREQAKESRFTLEIKLREGRREQKLEARISELKADIASRERQIKKLNQLIRKHRDAAVLPFPDPLLLFPSDSMTVVPPELSALILEWIDDEDELGRVHYARICPVPKELAPNAEALHIVTTDYAIGAAPQQNADIGLRLRGYERSGRGLAISRFDLSMAWRDQVNLKMFIPAGRSLFLVPRMQPGPLAARKLGAALFGEQDFTRHIALFAPVAGTEGSVKTFSLPMDQFRPLSEIKAGLAQHSVKVELFDEVDSFAESMLKSESTIDHIKETAEKTINREIVKEVMRIVSAGAERVQNVNQQRTDLDRMIKGHEADVKALKSEYIKLKNDFNRLWRSFDKMEKSTRKLTTTTEGAASTAASTVQIRNDIARVRDDIRNLSDLIAASKRSK